MTVVSGNILTSPVSMADAKSVLSQSTNDLETLCKASTINMWSARKPIYNTKVGVLSADDWKGRTITGYKTGGGLKKRAYVWADYITSMDSSTGNPTSQVWDYDKPVHDGSCKFRLHDFNGYYHNVGRAFTINTLFGNVSNILIPSSDGETGRNIAFSFSFTNPTPDGGIAASELFGDCASYYPCIILTYGSGSYQYAKTAPYAVASYASGSVTININTADFASAIAAEYRSSHSGDPYANAPLTTGSKWTACFVLLSQALTSGVYKIPSSATIVRLEYASGVDRKTLPIKQSKWMNIDWMKCTIKIKKIAGYQRMYQVDSVVVTSNVLSTTSMTFSVEGKFDVHTGTCYCSGISGNPLTISNWSSMTLSGTTGEVSKTLTFGETKMNCEDTSVSYQYVNVTLKFTYGGNSYQKLFNFMVNDQQPEYTKTDNLY